MAFGRSKREHKPMNQGDTNIPDTDTPQGEHVEPKGPPGAGSADPVAELEQRIDAHERELEEAKSLRLRALADFQNYQRRALQNEDEAKRQGAASVLRTVIAALDHFDQALAQPVENLTPEQTHAGLKLIRDEILRAIENNHNVSIIRPDANDEFTPGRHE